MTIVWTLLAIEDRETIFGFIEADRPRAAARVDDQIERQIDSSLTAPEMGRPGRIAGTRELVVQQTPYIAAYFVQRNMVRILRVLHGAQQWPSALDSR